ncbi:hypothetical protein [Comamonas sp. JUb58]|uniref:hypothetical protein n=1 Tax=Comamonas sp. JUb58 TaxID=2485114 RepID=UPI0010614C72|nr:hypothetical protein [Comamonas sp. JUb58]TDS68171.1 hypothetical protein EDF71_1432 [Comamonas sp. JUb58]
MTVQHFDGFTPLPQYPTPEMDDGPYGELALKTTQAYPVMIDEMTTAAAVIENNAEVSQQQAQRAVDAATDAAQVQDIVLGAANFKGNYADLAGALPMPASVKHAGRFWMLTRNLANVAADVPGVSTAWTSLDSGQVVTQKITANTTGIAGVKYLIAGPGVTLTLPAAWNKGDRIGYQLVAPVNGQKINFGATPVMGNALGLVEIDVPRVNDNWQYEDNTLGLIAQ